MDQGNPYSASTALTPHLKAYRVSDDHAWHVFSMIQTRWGRWSDPRLFLAAMNDDVPQLLFVCTAEGQGLQPVEWLYSTFGNPDKTSFVFSKAAMVAAGQESERPSILVDRMVRRFKFQPLDVDVVAKSEGMGWREMIRLISVRLEMTQEPFDGDDQVDGHFQSVVVPRLVEAARLTSQDTAASAGNTKLSSG